MQFLQRCNRKASKIHEDVKRYDSSYKLNAEETIFREQNASLEWENDPQSLICGHRLSCLWLRKGCGTRLSRRDKYQGLYLERGVIHLEAQLRHMCSRPEPLP